MSKVTTIINLSLGVFATFCSANVLTSYFSENYGISIRNPVFRTTFATIHHYSLIENKIFCKEKQFDGRTAGFGIDTNGRMVIGLRKLGFNDVEIGPVPLHCSADDDPVFSLGLLNVISNLNGFKQPVSLVLIPNYEVLKYVPYILPNHLAHAVQSALNLSHPGILSRILIKTDFMIQDTQLNLTNIAVQKAYLQGLILAKKEVINLKKHIKLGIFVNEMQSYLIDQVKIQQKSRNGQLKNIQVKINQNDSVTLSDLVKYIINQQPN